MILTGSRTHDALIGLLCASLGADVDADLVGLAGDVAPEDLAELASLHFVHTNLHAALLSAPRTKRALPEDFGIFAEEMQRAGSARNATILDQISDLNETLAGIEAVLLKGSVELVVEPSAVWGPVFLNDIDILVPIGSSEKARERLLERGYFDDPNAGFQATGRHQMPALYHDEKPVPVELHTEAGGGRVKDFLSADAIFSRSGKTPFDNLKRPSEIDGVRLLVLHSVYAEPHAVLRLREPLRFAGMRRRLDAETLSQAATGPEAYSEAFAYMMALADAFETGDPPSNPKALAALELTARPMESRLSYLRGVLATYARLLRQPDGISHAVKRLTSSSDIRKSAQFHLSKLKNMK